MGACSTPSTLDAGLDAGTNGGDAGTPRDPNKNCVKPGTPNNELGVAGYCDPMTDVCKAVSDGDGGTLSSSCNAGYAPPDLWFCTRACAKGHDETCGSTAYCDCQNAVCGCVPKVCGNPPDAGVVDAARDARD